MPGLEGFKVIKFKTRRGSLLGILIILACLVMAACQAQQSTPLIENRGTSTITAPSATGTPSAAKSTLRPISSVTSMPATSTSEPSGPTLTPSPTLIGPQIVYNGGFDDGLQGWENPYGVLELTSSEYHNGPSAARLVTNSTTGFLEYRVNPPKRGSDMKLRL